jgi:hypothetical protein
VNSTPSPRTIGPNIEATFGRDWPTDQLMVRLSDGDFVLIMNGDDFDALAEDETALITYFGLQRTEHAAGRPTGSTRAERVAGLRDMLESAT